MGGRTGRQVDEGRQWADERTRADNGRTGGQADRGGRADERTGRRTGGQVGRLADGRTGGRRISEG